MKAYMVYKSGLKNMIMECESELKMRCVIFESHMVCDDMYGMKM